MTAVYIQLKVGLILAAILTGWFVKHITFSNQTIYCF